MRIHQFSFFQSAQCTSPAIPIYCQAIFSDKMMPKGSTVTYKCDAGYELFGSETRTCQENGRWSGSLPFCGEFLFVFLLFAF